MDNAANKDIDAVADLVCSELEAVDDRCDDEVSTIWSELRDDNLDEVEAIDWSAVAPEAILDHPKVRAALVARITSFIGSLTYMTPGL